MAFLGVDPSVTGRRWVGPAPLVTRAAETLSQHLGFAPAVAQILARLGVSVDDAQAYLTPALRDLLPNPRHLRDMEPSAARLVHAVSAGQKIAIFADYDVDGGASAALLITWLRELGLDATLYVPDRVDEGYGPNIPAMRDLARSHDLIICVDCGTLSHDAIAAAVGADVIVLDHHLGGETLPPALGVVNPNRQDEDGSIGHLCAAAVVFLTLVEANRHLRETGAAPPNLLAMLDLVALATVADVAPLIGVNRAFVRQGLVVMAGRTRPGLAALADVAGLQTTPAAYHLGYLLGPRINAGGRVGKADLGARLLSTQDPQEAAALAAKLHELNADRREIEAQVQAAALAQAEERGLDAPLVWAAGDGWHPGVVGIVAARLKEKANRPAVVIGIENGQAKGSGRSVSGIDLGASIQRLASDGFIEKGGGHKMAAGLSMSQDQVETAMARLAELLDKQGAGALGVADLRIDGVLMPGAARPELIDDIEKCGPFGAGAPGPRFAFPDVKITFAKEVGTGHVKARVSDGLGASIDAIAFGALDTELGPALLDRSGAPMHVAGRLEINTWGGRRQAQLRIEDLAKPE